ncbi:LysR family transcriptional regulator [Actinomadura litoris]|uniref:LysR family transcriptional regulator n=1 Tax=Actinomadura litoris TaxID=2678616 RepID=A0A7K1L304_9ACTN|nr:LysR family transcriptional regulator [Actinomadura litoris]MUN38655.1 LysR family transcriptional regulator [Actinomadura litoris]
MELRRLRYFVAVADEGHFGRAAERLHIAQPPLSLQIKKLEGEVGVTLLDRSTRRVALTPAGERFLGRARAILASVDDARAEAVRVAAGEVGRVSIGFIGTATYAMLPALARRLRAELPGVELDLKGEMLTPDQADALREGRLDLAVVRTPLPGTELDVRPLRRERLIVALPEGHPLADGTDVDLRNLREDHFLSYPSRHRSVIRDAVLEACRRAGYRPRLVQEVAETSTLLVFVAAGLGVALVPESVRYLPLPGVVFRPLTGSPVHVELAVATRDGEASPLVARVRAALLAMYRET